MFVLKTPKGCFDVTSEDIAITSWILDRTTDIFKKHGAEQLDTPSMELTDVLKNKYGDDSKLIFDIVPYGEKQNDENTESKNELREKCSLRYDLTVSLCRYLAQNKIKKLKRFQYGKVFRRDLPNVKQGRFCEFWQCDFDICGEKSIVADAEVLKIAVECLQELLKGQKFVIKVNHRKLHVAFLKLANVHEDLHNRVCSTIDKMDKICYEDFVHELEMKGLTTPQIDLISDYVKIKGKDAAFLETLKGKSVYQTKDGKEAIDNLEKLIEYCQAFKISEYLVFDLSLSRGTDYYTGMIFEASCPKHKDKGTLLAGGRYDNMVRDFIRTKTVGEDDPKDELDVPCVGLSVGVSRIHAILKKMNQIRQSRTSVLVGTFGGEHLAERLAILNDLWREGISAETFYKDLPHQKQADMAKKKKIPIIVAIGQKEIDEGSVKISCICDVLKLKKEARRDDFVGIIKQILNEISVKEAEKNLTPPLPQ